MNGPGWSYTGWELDEFVEKNLSPPDCTNQFSALDQPWRHSIEAAQLNTLCSFGWCCLQQGLVFTCFGRSRYLVIDPIMSTSSATLLWWMQALPIFSLQWSKPVKPMDCLSMFALALRPQHIHPDALSEDDLQVDILYEQLLRGWLKICCQKSCLRCLIMFHHVLSCLIMSYLVDDRNQALSGIEEIDLC